jgi:hypothetical protein
VNTFGTLISSKIVEALQLSDMNKSSLNLQITQKFTIVFSKSPRRSLLYPYRTKHQCLILLCTHCLRDLSHKPGFESFFLIPDVLITAANKLICFIRIQNNALVKPRKKCVHSRRLLRNQSPHSCTS